MDEDTSGFYKHETGVLFTGRKLEHKDWTLTVDNKDSFTLPHDGWQYYDSIADACAAYNLDTEEWTEILWPSDEIII